MSDLPGVFLRETVWKALAAAPEGLTLAELAARVERELHADVFPRGSEGRIPTLVDELARAGILTLRDGRAWRSAADDDPRLLADWFDVLGGVVEIDSNLYRAPLPYAAEHFRALREAGVRVLYSFEEAVPGDVARAEGLDWRPHFWTDNGRPTPAQMDAFVQDFLALPDDAPAAVHCKGGLGRTGMAATCVLIARGWAPDHALEHYWRRVPLAREIMLRYGQAEFVRRWAAARARA